MEHLPRSQALFPGLGHGKGPGNEVDRLQTIANLKKLKAAKYETQKPSTCLFRCKFLSMFPGFHLA